MKVDFVGTVEEYKEFLNEELKRINKLKCVKYIDLGLPSGTLWADKNVGAETSYEFGEYYIFEDLPKNTPTKEQFEELIKYCPHLWDDDKKGIWFFNIKDTNKKIFLPAAGYRSGSSVDNVGTGGYYWGSTPNASDAADASGMGFRASGVYVGGNYRRDYARPARLVNKNGKV